VAQIKQIVDNEKDKAARIRLRFERSLVSRALIEEYSNFLPVVKKHWQRLENKKAYGGAIPTHRVVKTDVNRTTLAIGDRALDDLGPRSTESDSSAYVCCQCKSKQEEGIFLTCAACLGRICASCCSCEC
jgi:hypothetical protein